jgi:signal transduction histidine kinase/CheY-like chemotaxis protein
MPMQELKDLELLINTTDDMLAVLDKHLVYRVVNNPYAFVFGRAREYFPGKSMRELFSHDPEHYNKVLEPILSTCLAGENVHFEQWIQVPGFGDQYLDLRYYPMRTEAGAIDGVVVRGCNRTEVMRSIEAIKRSEDMLKRTEGIARLGGWTFDVATNQYQWTDEMYAIHEVGHDFAITLENINKRIPAVHFDELVSKFQLALKGERTESVFEMETEKGNRKWVRSLSFPVTENGKVVRVEGTIQDITELRHAQDDLKRTEESLRRAQKMEAIGQLSGGIAHDFNNLLSIVVGNLELLENDLGGNADAILRLGNARNAALRGSALTRRLLNFSLQAPIPGKALDLNEVLRGTEVLISRSLTARVTVEMQLGDNLGLVEVSERDFEDSLINLALNASDAMADGGKLTFSTRNLVLKKQQYLNEQLIPAGAYVEVTVTDTGRGMTSDIMGKIFEPYFTTKPSDKGSGLGLAMVYGFVQRSKGWILVDSTPGAGSRFRILLPKSEQRAVPPAPAVNVKEKAPEAGHETILLVDDEIEILNLNNTILSNKGYKVLCSNNGDEAIQVIEKNGANIDLLFTDVVMPGRLNGFELAEEALKLRPRLKVLFTTGYARALGEETRKRWGRNILQKPFRSVDMTRKVREVLDAGT